MSALGLALKGGNPFAPGRLHVAFALLPAASGPRRLLDYGCGYGGFLLTARKALCGELYGCDTSEEAVAVCQASGGEAVSFLQVQAGERLPFPEGFFTDVLLCDVLEHVGSAGEVALLAELRRVLQPCGALVLTVPHAGTWAWADHENLKFRWPGLHRRLYALLRDEPAYQRNYSRTLGNFTPGAQEHKHYTEDELARLLSAAGFGVEEVRKFGFASPLLQAALATFEKVPLPAGPVVQLLWRLRERDLARNAGSRSSCIGIRAKKLPEMPGR